MEAPEHMRRRAAEMEETARQISLRPDREKLLSIARRLRCDAEELEAKQRATKP